MTIGVSEGTTTVQEAAAHLRKRGMVGHAVDRVVAALSALVPGAAARTDPGRARRL